MWAKYRRWKHAAVGPLALLAYLFGDLLPDGSAAQYFVLAATAALVLAYLAEEVWWNLAGRGRPCPTCGHRVRVVGFRLLPACPRCGAG